MIYPRLSELPDLLTERLVSSRPHPHLPLRIYNYTAKAQFMPPAQWTPAMTECRGLILGPNGEVVARPFRKFWNLDQVLGQVPPGDFEVWEKMDGWLGIVCYYAGERVVSTRGSFESQICPWLRSYFDSKHPHFYPEPGIAYCFEIIHPETRIVVDYHGAKHVSLLAVLDEEGRDVPRAFDLCTRFAKPRRYGGLDFAAINGDPRFADQEGFVCVWPSGFRAKVKLDEYKRLHRLITNCSNRAIWDLLRTGSDLKELRERVPADFAAWFRAQARVLKDHYAVTLNQARLDWDLAPKNVPRREFAEWAKAQAYPGLLFRMLDRKPVEDMIWKLIEPKWERPFRTEGE